MKSWFDKEKTLYLQLKYNSLNIYTMTKVTFILIVLVVVVLFVVLLYHHKKHIEYKMSDIEKAIRSAYPEGVSSVEKRELVKAVKKYFHCSSKEAHYIIGVARRKKIVDIAVEKVSLHQS